SRLNLSQADNKREGSAQLLIIMALLRPSSRHLVFLAVIGMYLGIALFMGLPWCVLAMLAFDAIFIPQRPCHAAERAARSVIRTLRNPLKKAWRELDESSDEVRQLTTVGSSTSRVR